jgi:hypothetical protein
MEPSLPCEQPANINAYHVPIVVYIQNSKVRSESRCALRLRYVDVLLVLVFDSQLVDITSKTLCKCTTTFRTECSTS